MAQKVNAAEQAFTPGLVGSEQELMLKKYLFAICFAENEYLCSHETNEPMDAGHHSYNVWSGDVQLVFEG